MLGSCSFRNLFSVYGFFHAFFIFLLGYSTIIAYFVVGLNCAQYLSPSWGKKFYYVYAVVAFLIFSFAETQQALSVMAIVDACCWCSIAIGIFRLTKEIHFDFNLNRKKNLFMEFFPCQRRNLCAKHLDNGASDKSTIVGNRYGEVSLEDSREGIRW